VGRAPGAALIAARDRALAHLVARQRPRGDWEGEMVWCPIITAQYVIVLHVAGRPIEARARAALRRHFEVTRTPEGGWGLHPESSAYVFVTALSYVALRLLGLDADEPMMKDAGRWLRSQPGGVLAIPTWGKFWLALLDLYDWRGVNPTPPELFLLPSWLPVHPVRFYCHTRLIYLGMAWLAGRRVRASLGPLTSALRAELYDQPYAAIDFAAHRDDLSPSDVYVRPGAASRALARLLAAWERACPATWRRRALDACLARIRFEQRASAWQGLSPVNGLLSCLALWAHDPADPDLGPSLDGLEAWRWEDEAEGQRYAGARSNAWDTAFALRALVAAGDAEAVEAVRRGAGFLRSTQIRDDLPPGAAGWRDPIRGGWCFSDGAHRWPVSDCTAEAVGALLAAEGAGRVPAEDRLPPTRLAEAVSFILARQNVDGGFGTYERRRGPLWLEALNLSEMFGQCMTERSYVECTASCVGALAEVRAAHPALETAALEAALARGVRFLRSTQQPDGAVPGFWGINVSYGLFHFVRGLRAAGVPRDDPALIAAARWLVGAQRADGGWGEHHRGSLEGRYVEHPESQAVMTSWALLALMEILPPGADPIERGVAWLMGRQRPDGGWPEEAVNGVFFGSAMLDYRLYRSYFPAWALARAARPETG
jgi:2,3-oxidosqualene cyclase